MEGQHGELLIKANGRGLTGEQRAMVSLAKNLPATVIRILKLYGGRPIR